MWKKQTLMIALNAGMLVGSGYDCPADRAVAEPSRPLTASIGMEMVWLNPDGDSEGYWVGKYEVTQAQYLAMMGDDGHRVKWRENPADAISPGMALTFCRRLTDRDRQAGLIPKDWSYSLPTEKEWEYFVADAGRDDSEKWAEAEPVGSRNKRNRLGLHDVRGSVWEWTLDDSGNPVARGGSSWDSELSRDPKTRLSWQTTKLRDEVIFARLLGQSDNAQSGKEFGFRCVLVKDGLRGKVSGWSNVGKPTNWTENDQGLTIEFELSAKVYLLPKSHPEYVKYQKQLRKAGADVPQFDVKYREADHLIIELRINRNEGKAPQPAAPSTNIHGRVAVKMRFAKRFRRKPRHRSD